MLEVKKWVARAFAALCIVSGIAFTKFLWADSTDAKSALKTSTFTVENMTCATCPITVRKAMSRVAGVEEIAIDFETKIAKVSYDPMRAEPRDVADASTDVGFPATIVPESTE